MGVTISCKNLKHAIINGQNTDIKCPTTKVKDKNVLLTTFLVQSIGNGCSCWLVNDSSNI